MKTLRERIEDRIEKVTDEYEPVLAWPKIEELHRVLKMMDEEKKYRRILEW